MRLMALFTPVTTFLRSALTALSKLDGKPGLSSEDVRQLLNWVSLAERTFKGHDGRVKHEAVLERLKDKEWVAEWIAPTIVWLAYEIATRTGLLKRLVVVLAVMSLGLSSTSCCSVAEVSLKVQEVAEEKPVPVRVILYPITFPVTVAGFVAVFPCLLYNDGFTKG